MNPTVMLMYRMFGVYSTLWGIRMYHMWKQKKKIVPQQQEQVK